MAVLSRTFFSQLSCYSVVLQPHGCIATIMVWALPRSLATTGGIINLFSLPTGTKMFQFPAFALCFCIVTVLQTAGLSHSEILGSRVICTYPRLIAAYHVLHRLLMPRHSPYALLSLTIFELCLILLIFMLIAGFLPDFNFRYCRSFFLICITFAFHYSIFKFRSLQDLSCWWAQVDSNHRPHAYQACALTT